MPVSKCFEMRILPAGGGRGVEIEKRGTVWWGGGVGGEEALEKRRNETGGQGVCDIQLMSIYPPPDVSVPVSEYPDA